MTGQARAEVIDLGVSASRPGKRSTLRWPCSPTSTGYAASTDTSTYYRCFGIRRHLPDSELGAVAGAGTQHVTLLASIDEQLIGIGEYRRVLRQRPDLVA